MSIEYRPVGNACNISCTYCYQDPMRAAGNQSTRRNWPRAKGALKNLKGDFSIFGGEPLLAGHKHLEEVWEFGLDQFKVNGIQTNGILIDEEFCRLFKKYRVQVGVSIDGPGNLNSARCDVVETAQVHDNIALLHSYGIAPSIICTLSRANAAPDKIDILIDWMKALKKDFGIYFFNYHILELETCHDRKKLALSDEESIQAFSRLFDHAVDGVRMEPLESIQKEIRRERGSNCVWNACDPVYTVAVMGVEADGSLSNCGRTNKDGVTWLKSAKGNKLRYLSLAQTPQEFGGCRDCEYWSICKGNCPGTAVGGDWRYRTEHCLVWKRLIPIVAERIGVSLDDWRDRNNRFNASLSVAETTHIDTPHTDWHIDSQERVEKGVGITWR